VVAQSLAIDRGDARGAAHLARPCVDASQTGEACRIIGQDIAAAEFDWSVGMFLCRSLGKRLWESFSFACGATLLLPCYPNAEVSLSE
jgi:hypothetical protein